MTSGVLNSNLEAKWQPTHLDADHKHMLELHLGGLKHVDIAKELNCTPQHVCNIVTSQLGQAYCDARLAQRTKLSDQRFLGLQEKVVDTIEDGLDAEDMSYRLQAADKWLKAHGRYARSEGGTPQVSAEDIVDRLLKRGALQAQSTVHIHDSNVVIASEDAKRQVPARSIEPPLPFQEPLENVA